LTLTRPSGDRVKSIERHEVNRSMRIVVQPELVLSNDRQDSERQTTSVDTERT